MFVSGCWGACDSLGLPALQRLCGSGVSVSELHHAAQGLAATLASELRNAVYDARLCLLFVVNGAYVDEHLGCGV